MLTPHRLTSVNVRASQMILFFVFTSCHTASAQVGDPGNGKPRRELPATTSAQSSGKPNSMVSVRARVSDRFPEVLERVVQASKENFKSIRGAPIGNDTTSLTVRYGAGFPTLEKHFTVPKGYVWRTTAVLPGARNCILWQLAPLTVPMEYVCDVSSLDAAQVMQGIVAALGIGWRMFDCSSSTVLEKESTCFVKQGEDLTSSNERLLFSDGVIYVAAPRNSRPSDESPASRPTDSIAAAIARIETAQHSSLPTLNPGSGNGPITIQNDTSSMLSIYFSGSVSQKVEIPPHGRATAVLGPGMYKVAGELSDKSVRPFFGVRNYSGGETERFYVSP